MVLLESNMRLKRAIFNVLFAAGGTVVAIGFLTLATITTMRLPSIYERFQETSRLLSGKSRAGVANAVLVLAYMNSGSTYTGRILGLREDAFYFYEPLYRFSVWDFFVDNDTMCSTVKQSCRKSSHNRQTAENALLDIFSCRLRNIQGYIVPGVTSEARFVGYSWSRYRQCIRKDNTVDICLSIMEGVCRHSDHVITKVLRLTVGAVERLLLSAPNLKVVQLFRDPRAIINSRIETQGYPFLKEGGKMSVALLNNARALCDKMSLDIADGYEMMAKFPDRFRFIHYEDIHNNRHSLRKLHDFLEMATSTRKLNTLIESTSHHDKVRTEAKRITDNAYWWTKHMKFDAVSIVNSVCSNVIWQLGYPEIKSKSDLTNFNTSRSLTILEFPL